MASHNVCHFPLHIQMLQLILARFHEVCEVTGTMDKMDKVVWLSHFWDKFIVFEKNFHLFICPYNFTLLFQAYLTAIFGGFQPRRVQTRRVQTRRSANSPSANSPQIVNFLSNSIGYLKLPAFCMLSIT